MDEMQVFSLRVMEDSERFAGGIALNRASTCGYPFDEIADSACVEEVNHVRGSSDGGKR